MNVMYLYNLVILFNMSKLEETLRFCVSTLYKLVISVVSNVKKSVNFMTVTKVDQLKKYRKNR